jgi:hypothetical protein
VAAISEGIVAAIVFGVLVLLVLPIGIGVACCFGVGCCAGSRLRRGVGSVVMVGAAKPYSATTVMMPAGQIFGGGPLVYSGGQPSFPPPQQCTQQIQMHAQQHQPPPGVYAMPMPPPHTSSMYSTTNANSGGSSSMYVPQLPPST